MIKEKELDLKELDNLDDFELSLDGLDSSDIDFDDREPISKPSIIKKAGAFTKSVLKGVTSRVERILEHKFPHLSSLVSDVRSLPNEIRESVRSHSQEINEFAESYRIFRNKTIPILANKYNLPRLGNIAKSILPGNSDDDHQIADTYSSYKRKEQEELPEEIQAILEERISKNTEVSSGISTTSQLKRKKSIEEAKSKIALNRLEDRFIAYAKHADIMSGIGVLADNIKLQTEIQTKFQVPYYKKSLEIGYKSFIVQKSMLDVQMNIGEILRTRLDAIQKNTALPDLAKVTLGEVMGDVFKRNIFGGVQRSISGVLGRIVANMTKSVSDTLGMLGMPLSMLNMQAEFEEDFGSDFGMLGSTKPISNLTELIATGTGQYVLPFLARKTKLGSVLLDKLNIKENTNKIFANIADYFSNKTEGKVDINVVRDLLSENNIDLLAEGAPEKLKLLLDNLRKGRISENIEDPEKARKIETIENLLSDFIMSDLQEGYRVYQNKGTRLFDPAIFDLKTHTTINDVIPGYLAKILTAISSIDTKTPELPGATMTPIALKYDYRAKEFVSDKELQIRTLERTLGDVSSREMLISQPLSQIKTNIQEDTEKPELVIKWSDVVEDLKVFIKNTIKKKYFPLIRVKDIKYMYETEDYAFNSYSTDILKGIKNPKELISFLYNYLYRADGTLDRKRYHELENLLLRNTEYLNYAVENMRNILTQEFQENREYLLDTIFSEKQRKKGRFVIDEQNLLDTYLSDISVKEDQRITDEYLSSLSKNKLDELLKSKVITKKQYKEAIKSKAKDIWEKVSSKTKEDTEEKDNIALQNIAKTVKDKVVTVSEKGLETLRTPFKKTVQTIRAQSAMERIKFQISDRELSTITDPQELISTILQFPDSIIESLDYDAIVELGTAYYIPVDMSLSKKELLTSYLNYLNTTRIAPSSILENARNAVTLLNTKLTEVSTVAKEYIRSSEPLQKIQSTVKDTLRATKAIRNQAIDTVRREITSIQEIPGIQEQSIGDGQVPTPETPIRKVQKALSNRAVRYKGYLKRKGFQNLQEDTVSFKEWVNKSVTPTIYSISTRIPLLDLSSILPSQPKKTVVSDKIHIPTGVVPALNNNETTDQRTTFREKIGEYYRKAKIKSQQYKDNAKQFFKERAQKSQAADDATVDSTNYKFKDKVRQGYRALKDKLFAAKTRVQDTLNDKIRGVYTSTQTSEINIEPILSDTEVSSVDKIKIQLLSEISTFNAKILDTLRHVSIIAEKPISKPNTVIGSILNLGRNLTAATIKAAKLTTNMLVKAFTTGMLKLGVELPKNIIAFSIQGASRLAKSIWQLGTKRKVFVDIYIYDPNTKKLELLVDAKTIEKHGVYPDGTKVDSSYNIKDTVYDNTTGNVLISKLHIEKGLYDKNGEPLISKNWLSRLLRFSTSAVKTLLGGYFTVFSTIGSLAIKGAKLLVAKKNPYIDVYLKDNVHPDKVLVYGEGIRKGEYVFLDGTPVKSAYDIDQPVYKLENGEIGNCVVTREHILRGLVDIHNNPVTKFAGKTLLGKALSIATAPINLAFKAGTGLAKMAVRGAKALVEKGKEALQAIPEGWRTLKEAIGRKIESMMMVGQLEPKHIQDLVTTRLDTIISILKKGFKIDVEDDTTGEGLRDNSYEEYRAQKNREQETTKDKREKIRTEKEQSTKAQAASFAAALKQINKEEEEAEEKDSGISDWLGYALLFIPESVRNMVIKGIASFLPKKYREMLLRKLGIEATKATEKVLAKEGAKAAAKGSKGLFSTIGSKISSGAQYFKNKIGAGFQYVRGKLSGETVQTMGRKTLNMVEKLPGSNKVKAATTAALLAGTYYLTSSDESEVGEKTVYPTPTPTQQLPTPVPQVPVADLGVTRADTAPVIIRRDELPVMPKDSIIDTTKNMELFITVRKVAYGLPKDTPVEDLTLLEQVARDALYRGTKLSDDQLLHMASQLGFSIDTENIDLQKIFVHNWFIYKVIGATAIIDTILNKLNIDIKDINNLHLKYNDDIISKLITSIDRSLSVYGKEGIKEKFHIYVLNDEAYRKWLDLTSKGYTYKVAEKEDIEDFTKSSIQIGKEPLGSGFMDSAKNVLVQGASYVGADLAFKGVASKLGVTAAGPIGMIPMALVDTFFSFKDAYSDYKKGDTDAAMRKIVRSGISMGVGAITAAYSGANPYMYVAGSTAANLLIPESFINTISNGINYLFMGKRNVPVFSGMSPNAWELFILRCQKYGIDDYEKHYSIIIKLEENTVKGIDANYVFDPKTINEKFFLKLADTFNIGKDAEPFERLKYIRLWFSQRFVPVINAYYKVIQYLGKNYNSALILNKSEAEQITYDFLNTCDKLDIGKYSAIKLNGTAFSIWYNKRKEIEYESPETLEEIEKKDYSEDISRDRTVRTELPSSTAINKKDIAAAERTTQYVEENKENIITQTPTSGSTSRRGTADYTGSSIGTEATKSTVPTTKDASELGALSSKYESRGSSLAIGYDPGGGTSYGKYQLASRPGTFSEFISWLLKTGKATEFAKRIIQAAGSPPSGRDWGNTYSKQGAVPDAWIAGIKAGELPPEVEQEFIIETHYLPVINKIRKKNPQLAELIESSNVLKNVVYSSAVQQRNAGNLFLEVYREGMTPEQLIDAIYAKRATQFSSQPTHIQESVKKRLINERADARAMLANEKSSGGAIPLPVGTSPKATGTEIGGLAGNIEGTTADLRRPAGNASTKKENTGVESSKPTTPVTTVSYTPTPTPKTETTGVNAQSSVQPVPPATKPVVSSTVENKIAHITAENNYPDVKTMTGVQQTVYREPTVVTPSPVSAPKTPISTLENLATQQLEQLKVIANLLSNIDKNTSVVSTFTQELKPENLVEPLKTLIEQVKATSESFATIAENTKSITNVSTDVDTTPFTGFKRNIQFSSAYINMNQKSTRTT